MLRALLTPSGTDPQPLNVRLFVALMRQDWPAFRMNFARSWLLATVCRTGASAAPCSCVTCSLLMARQARHEGPGSARRDAEPGGAVLAVQHAPLRPAACGRGAIRRQAAAVLPVPDWQRIPWVMPVRRGGRAGDSGAEEQDTVPAASTCAGPHSGPPPPI